MTASEKTKVIKVDKEMGISHREFFRLVARFLEGRDHVIDGTHVLVRDGERRLEIDLDEEGERRLDPVVMPVTWVRLAFKGYDQEEAEELLAQFDLRFQRAGG